MTTTPDTADVELLVKVRKLLAMAEGTSNANEADAFARKAAELIAMHRIDPARLADAGRPGDDPLAVIEVPLGRGAYVRGRLALLGAVAEPHGCHVVFEARPSGTVAFAAGFRSDLDTVEMLYASLHAQAAARMARERRATAAATQQWRRSFLFGYAVQLRSTFDAAAASARVSSGHPSNSVLPALRARDRRVDEYARQQFGRVVQARPARRVAPTGFDAGRRAASSADLGRRRLSERFALGRGA